ncbi:MAG TPA: hypothetical protein VK982_05160 [Bacteroidales bacterium]|nr:hypothetical protein [Bacteroidales bacterium]
MRKIQKIKDSVGLTTDEMLFTRGGKKLIKMVYKQDEQGTYYELHYDDGSIVYVGDVWYA